MLVVDLGKWMNKSLIDWGIDPVVADRFDETIMALLMIVTVSYTPLDVYKRQGLDSCRNEGLDWIFETNGCIQCAYCIKRNCLCPLNV